MVQSEVMSPGSLSLSSTFSSSFSDIVSMFEYIWYSASLMFVILAVNISGMPCSGMETACGVVIYIYIYRNENKPPPPPPSTPLIKYINFF